MREINGEHGIQMKAFPTDPLPSPSEIANLQIHDVELRINQPIETSEDELNQTPLEVGEITDKRDPKENLISDSEFSPPTNLKVDPNTGEFVFIQHADPENQTSIHDDVD